MQSRKKTMIMLMGLAAVVMLSGCTNWKKRYQELQVEHENLQGLYQREQQEKGQLQETAAQRQQTIEELQRKITELEQSPAEASGFGEEYDVAFDPQKGTVTVTLPNEILFPPGKAALKSARNADLDHIVSVLKSEYSGRMVDVVGHTDSDPIQKSGWDDNWELSAERALAVTRYLVQHGIPEENVRAVGRGSTQPIASNSTAAGKAKNRRVEIVVHMR
jgi:chemotaxis protein MotB